MFHERSAERVNGGLGRGFSRGNGREVNQVQKARIQQDRQEEEWSIPSNVEWRENDTERRESSRAPPAPPPSEDRVFTDWSSSASHRERTSPQNTSERDVVPNINQPDNQTAQPGSEPAKIEVMGNTLSNVLTYPSTSRQLNQVGTRLIDRETITSDIEVRSQREEMRVEDSSNDEVIMSCHRDVWMPVTRSNLSLYDTELSGGSHIRTHNIDIIPQLDGPRSIHSRRRTSENARIEQESFCRTAMTCGIEHPDDSSNNSHSYRRAYDDQRPPMRRRYHGGKGRPPDRESSQDRGYPGRGRPPDNGRPPDRSGGPQMVEGPRWWRTP